MKKVGGGCRLVIFVEGQDEACLRSNQSSCQLQRPRSCQRRCNLRVKNHGPILHPTHEVITVGVSRKCHENA